MGYERHFGQDSEDRSKLSVPFLLHAEGHSRAQSAVAVAALIPRHLLADSLCRAGASASSCRFLSSVYSTPESGTFLAPCQRIPDFSAGHPVIKVGVLEIERITWVLVHSCGFPIFSSCLLILLASGYSARNVRNIFL